MFFKRRSQPQEPLSTPAVGNEGQTSVGTRREPGSIAMTTTSETGLNVLVEASRRITSYRDRDDVHRAAIDEAIQLTGAEVGAFVTIPALVGASGADTAGDAAADAARFSHQSHPQMFVSSSLGDGAIRRCVSERAEVCDIVTDEPSLALSPIALAAVPAIASSQVVGVIVVLRSADEPFGNTELETLRLLAPVAASAHAAAAPVAELAEMDQLTRLANRRRLDRDFLDLTREGQVGFASIKIDFFGQFQKANGQEATEELIRQVALIITSSIRPDDVAYRSGDDEFGVLLPEASKKESAWVAERVRQAIAAVTIAGMQTQPAGHVTVSVGVTAGENEDPQSLTERALSARHEAEEAGHDRVITDEAI